MKEIVLYYAPENTAHMGLIKGVLVQMGVRIKNLTPERCEKKIGLLTGMDGFEDDTAAPVEGEQASCQAMSEELMVLNGFTDDRLNELLMRLKKAGVPRTVLKAMVTETNAHWTVCELYEHLTEERRRMERR